MELDGVHGETVFQVCAKRQTFTYNYKFLSCHDIQGAKEEHKNIVY